MRSNKPLHINTLLGKSELARLLDRARELNRLDARLRELLPPPLNDHCRVLSLRDDILVVAADSPVWAARLRFQSGPLARQFSRSGAAIVRTVQVRVRPLPGRQPDRPVRRQAPGGRKHSHALKQAAREIRDPGLRAALLRLAAHQAPAGGSRAGRRHGRKTVSGPGPAG